MLDRTDDISIATENWLAQFEQALAEPADVLLRSLFHADSYWRDVLALSWNLQTSNGADAILKELKLHAGRATPRGFCIDPDSRRAAPRHPRRHRMRSRRFSGLKRRKAAATGSCASLPTPATAAN